MAEPVFRAGQARKRPMIAIAQRAHLGRQVTCPRQVSVAAKGLVMVRDCGVNA